MPKLPFTGRARRDIAFCVLTLPLILPGPVVGFALLFTTLPVGNVNLIGSVIFALLLPMIEIGRTLLYLDLMARKDIEVVPATVAVAPAPAV